MDTFDAARLTSTIDDLEEHARTLRIAISRLESRQDQVAAFVQEYLDKLHGIQDQVSAHKAKLTEFEPIGEEIRQIHARHNQLQETQADTTTRLDREARGTLAEIERVRQVVTDSWQRIEQIRREIDPIPGKLQSQEDNHRRLIEAIQVSQNEISDLAKEVRRVTLRLDGMVERDKRVEDSFADVKKAFEERELREEKLSDGLRLLGERISRTEETVSEVLSQDAQRRGLEEQLQTQRLLISRLESQVAELVKSSSQHGTHLEELQRTVKIGEERRETLAQRVSDVAASIETVKIEFSDLLAEFGQMEEQHRSHLITELQQQVRDVKAKVAKARNR